MLYTDYPFGFSPEDILGEGVFSLGPVENPCRRDDQWRVLEQASDRTLLTGTVVGIEGLEGPFSCAVLDWQGLQVRIPGEKFFLADWDPNKPMPALYQQKMARMLGATVDFVPGKVCRRDSLILGDRAAALRKKQQDYFDTGLIRPGSRALARVTGVTREHVSVELFGVETDIPKKDLAWAWFPDARDLYRTGDVLPVQVTLTVRVRDGWSVLATCKDLDAQPDRERLLRLVPGSTYLGTITDVSDWEVQVRLDVGVNASAEPLPEGPCPEPGDQALVLIQGISLEDQIAYGSVTEVRPLC